MLSLLAVFAVSAAASASASAEHEWLVNGVRANGQKVTSTGGKFKLNEGGQEIICQKVTDTGTVTGMDDLATSIHFLECSTKVAGCLVRSEPGTTPWGLIQLNNIPTLIVLRNEAKKGPVVLADEFKE